LAYTTKMGIALARAESLSGMPPLPANPQN
jgi:hypothetical protein